MYQLLNYGNVSMQILMWMLIIIKSRSIIPAKLIGIFGFSQLRDNDLQGKLSVS